MKTLEGFESPTVVDDLLLVFPASVGNLMPPCDHYDHEDPLKQWAKTEQAAPYLAFQRTWFYSGLGADTEIYLKDGIDGDKALRHLRCIQGSYEPKHEHKELAVAWLLWRWSAAPPKAVPLKEIR